jgi:hypothetical protein
MEPKAELAFIVTLTPFRSVIIAFFPAPNSIRRKAMSNTGRQNPALLFAADVECDILRPHRNGYTPRPGGGTSIDGGGGGGSVKGSVNNIVIFLTSVA